MKRFAAIVAVLVLVAFVFASERSGRWPAVRAKHLQSHPTCAVCGTVADCEVHHVEGFAKHPEKELDLSNLITLCRHDHFLVGHGGRWGDWTNPKVRDDAAAIRLILDRIRKERR